MSNTLKAITRRLRTEMNILMFKLKYANFQLTHNRYLQWANSNDVIDSDVMILRVAH